MSITHHKVNIDFKLKKDNQILSVDADKLKYPLVLRKWQQGDWFIPIGMKGRKKLSDFFSDNKFSLKEKEDVWILCSEDDIIWIVGQRADDRYKVTDKTQNVLIIESM